MNYSTKSNGFISQNLLKEKIYLNPVKLSFSWNRHGNYIKDYKSKLALLTTREKEVLGFVAKGQKSSEIAASLAISRHTVDTHRRRIRGKLGLVRFPDWLRAAYELEQEM